MKTKIKSIFTYIWQNKTKKRVWIPTVVLVLILLMTSGSGSKGSSTYVFKAEPKEFVQNVSLTGKVIAAKNADMGFELSGRVSRVGVKVGDFVKKGQVLASLEKAD